MIDAVLETAGTPEPCSQGLDQYPETCTSILSLSVGFVGLKVMLSTIPAYAGIVTTGSPANTSQTITFFMLPSPSETTLSITSFGPNPTRSMKGWRRRFEIPPRYNFDLRVLSKTRFEVVNKIPGPAKRSPPHVCLRKHNKKFSSQS